MFDSPCFVYIQPTNHGAPPIERFLKIPLSDCSIRFMPNWPCRNYCTKEVLLAIAASGGSTKIACQTHQADSANRLIDAWGRIKIDALTAWFCNSHFKWHGTRNCEGRDWIAASSATSFSHNLIPFTSP